MELSATNGLLQSATTVTTASTQIGADIDCSSYSYVTLFIDYTKGDETSVEIVPYYSDGLETPKEYQDQSWTATAGTKTATVNEYQVSATGKYYITFDVRGVSVIRFKQSATAGTPTGTIYASYTLTDE